MDVKAFLDDAQVTLLEFLPETVVIITHTQEKLEWVEE